MTLKAIFDQITLFLRKSVGFFLVSFLCYELLFGWAALANPVFTDKTPGILHILKKVLLFIISLVFPITRFALTFPLASWGYFSWNFWKGCPAPPQNLKSKHQTIIAMIISFSISLYIVLFAAYSTYTDLEGMSKINAFIPQASNSFLAFSVPSTCTLFYALQFFFKNTALTWTINILLLIFPIGTVLYYIGLFTWVIFMISIHSL